MSKSSNQRVAEMASKKINNKYNLKEKISDKEKGIKNDKEAIKKQENSSKQQEGEMIKEKTVIKYSLDENEAQIKKSLPVESHKNNLEPKNKKKRDELEYHNKKDNIIDSLDCLNKLPTSISFNNDSFLMENSMTGDKYVFKEIDAFVLKKYKELLKENFNHPYVTHLLHSFLSSNDQNKYVLLFEWINGGPIYFLFRLNNFSIE